MSKAKPATQDFFAGSCPHCQQDAERFKIDTEMFPSPNGKTYTVGDKLPYIGTIRSQDIGCCATCGRRICAIFSAAKPDAEELRVWMSEHEARKKDRFWTSSHPMPTTRYTLNGFTN